MSEDPVVQSRRSINPYLAAGGLGLSRLRWDLNYRSWVSRSRLKGDLGTHIWKKGVIICNGPSLLRTDWALLEHVYTFGLNKINLLFDQIDFRPSSIVAVNPLVLEQNQRSFQSKYIPLFLDSHALKAGIGFKKYGFDA